MPRQPKAPPRAASDTVGKRIQFDRETWNAVDLLAREQMKDLQEIADEAFNDLLKKYGRTSDFRQALRLSATPTGVKSGAAKPSTRRSPALSRIRRGA